MAVLVLGAGCGDDRLSPDAGAIAGRIITLDTRAPLEGARVVVFSPADNRPVGPARTSGPDGRYRFDRVPIGDYYLIVYAGRRIVFEAMDAALEVRGGRLTTRDVVVAVYPHFPDGRAVTGVVTDAVTGATLAGAFVSVGSSDFRSLFGGEGLPWEAVTDEDGRFLLESVPTVSNGPFPIGLIPLVATKSGYRPGATGSSLRGEWIALPAAGDTAEVVLALQPGSGDRTVAGRIRHGETPVSGVPVALSYRDSTTVALDAGAAAPPGLLTAAGVRPELRPAAVAPDLVVTSDAGGYFEIRHVPPGRYLLQVAYLPDDGWVQVPGSAGLPEVVVGARNVTGIAVGIVPGMTYVSPAPGAVVADGRPRFTWRRVPGADGYFLILGGANDFLLTERVETADTTAQAPAGLWGEGDHARWTVLALREEEIVALGETIATFSVADRR